MSVRPRVFAAIIKDNQILMVLVEDGTRHFWTLPGGGVEEGETLEEAVLREVQEEVRLTGSVERFLYEGSYSQGPEYCFLVRCDTHAEALLGDDPELPPDRQVLKEIAWFPLEQMKEDKQVSQVINALNQNQPAPNVLPRSQPEGSGIPSSAITAFLEAVDAHQLGLHSFMLLRHGQVVAEAWWSPYGPERQHMMFSLSKSFTSTAVGLAVSEGLLTVEDRVVSFFPDKQVSDDVNLHNMRVKHLLSMSTGHVKETMGAVERQNEDWVQAILEQPVVHEPGTHFLYNSGASYMLSAIVQRLTGQTVHDYLQPRLFVPLGIEGSTWEKCPLGINTGGWGLTLKTEDIARFGQLYLQKGVWNGTRLIPEDWIEAATSFQVSNESNSNPDWKMGYGYQFWRSRHGAYRGDGAFGQFCVVMQEQDVVLAITAGCSNMQAMLDQVWEHLLPAIADGPVPIDEQARAELSKTIASLAYPPLQSDVETAVADGVSGKRYALSDNQRKIQAVEWHFDGDTCLVKVWGPLGEIQVRCGIGHWVEGVTHNVPGTVRIVASGMWESPDTFVMSWRMVETPFTDTLTCRFEDDRVSVRMERDVQFGSKEPIVIEGKIQ